MDSKGTFRLVSPQCPPQCVRGGAGKAAPELQEDALEAQAESLTTPNNPLPLPSVDKESSCEPYPMQSVLACKACSPAHATDTSKPPVIAPPLDL